MASETTKIENHIYQAALVTVDAVGISMTGKKILKVPLGTPGSLMGTLKLAIAISSSTVLINWIQDKGYLKPPFK